MVGVEYPFVDVENHLRLFRHDFHFVEQLGVFSHGEVERHVFAAVHVYFLLHRPVSHVRDFHRVAAFAYVLDDVVAVEVGYGSFHEVAVVVIYADVYKFYDIFGRGIGYFAFYVYRCGACRIDQGTYV